MTPFHSQLSIYISHNDIPSANSLIMQEMGKIYVYHRPDFIAMLQNSDLPAHADFADQKLIDMYFDNLHKKDLLVGSALLVNDKNKLSGFDGEMEMSDKAVKDSYRVMSSFLGGIPGVPDSAGYIKGHQFDWKYGSADGEQHSGIIPLLTAGAQAVGNFLGNRKKAKEEMQRAIALEKKKKAEAEKKRKTIMWVAIGGGVLLLGVIGFIIYKKKK